MPRLRRTGWVLDVIYPEDESCARKGHSAENLYTTRALAMNLTSLEKTNKRGIRGREKRAGWDNFYLGKSLKSECVCPERKSG